MKKLILSASALLLFAGVTSAGEFKLTTEIPEGITTPDKVETSSGTVNFTDGVPSRETAAQV